MLKHQADHLPVRKLQQVRELPQNDAFVEAGDNKQAKITSGGSMFK